MHFAANGFWALNCDFCTLQLGIKLRFFHDWLPERIQPLRFFVGARYIVGRAILS
jgi:hypothetical protein